MTNSLYRPLRLGRQAARHKKHRATGQREAAERVLLCLEVLAERGLIDLETGPQGVAVSLRQVERKVDLEASPILGRLRQAIRGGSAEA